MQLYDTKAEWRGARDATKTWTLGVLVLSCFAAPYSTACTATS